MPIPVRFAPRAAALCLTACVATTIVAGCASPADREAAAGHSVAPGAARSLRGGTVFVACEAADPAIRDVCRDQLADEVTARGARPVKRGSPAEASPVNGDDRLVADARAAGAGAVLVMTPRPVAVDEGGSGLSIGIGGFGFGGGRGSAVGGGVGVSAPLGAARVATGYVATGRVIDVATGRTVWTGRADAPPSPDLGSQFGGLALSLLDIADRDGLF